jgi:unsaturated chondroitin disaccharide hydrolase
MPLPSHATSGVTDVDQALAAAVRTVRSNIGYFGAAYPDDTTVDGRYTLRLRAGLADGANTGWTTGFWPGMLWLAHESTGDAEFADAGSAHVVSFRHRIDNRIDTGTHDLGFLYQLSCVVPAERQGDDSARDAALAAADALMERYIPVAGIIQAWGQLEDPHQRGRTIIDSLMNMPLLHWAARETGDDHYSDAANTHVKSLSDHIFRPDDSTFHTFYWDPATGAPMRGATEQGSADDSCWARGQAWGIYGFAINYRHTGNEEFLVAARRCAEYFLAQLGESHVPAWDLSEAPGPDTVRDSSAAAIAAAGLMEIDAVSGGEPRYRAAALAMMDALIEDFAPAPDDPSNALLLHGVYDMPKGVGIDEGTLWGDYFYLENLVRLANPSRPSYW